MNPRSDSEPGVVPGGQITPFAEVMKRKHLPALDGLRAISVGIVMVYHGGVEAVPGDLGVTAFFVLSGFLITWLLLREREKTGRVSLGGFYLRRSLRIFPAYFAFVGVSIVLDRALGDPWTVSNVVTALTYTVNYRNALGGFAGPIPHAWSLAVEEQFYLLWPLVFIMLANVSRTRKALVYLILGVCAWRAILYLGFGVPDYYVYHAFDTRFDSLAIGCLLAVLATSKAFLAWAPRTARRAWYPLPVLLLVVISRKAISPAWHYAFGFTVDSVLVAILVIQLLQLSSHPMWRWLDSRFAVWVGALSYPLYLWHIWGFSMADNLTRSASAPLNFVVGTLLSFVLASGSYYGIERYFLRLKARLDKSKQTKLALS